MHTLQEMRLQRGWSQQQLADMSGLSLRTIGRLENGQPSSMETLKALAAVFEVDLDTMRASTDAVACNLANQSGLGNLGHVDQPEAPNASVPPSSSHRLEAQTSQVAQATRTLRPPQLRASLMRHFLIYGLVIAFLICIDAFTSPERWWVQWPALGWGLALLLKAGRRWSALSSAEEQLH